MPKKQRRISKSEAVEAIKRLVPGTSFEVATNSERILISQTAETLRAAGVIGFSVHTRRTASGYEVSATKGGE